MSDSSWPHGLQHKGFPVHHQLPELAQTHVHGVSDAIQPSHPLASPSPPAFNLSQHQGLFKSVSSSHHMTKVLQLSFSISPSNEYSGYIPLGFTDWISLQSKGLSRVFSKTINSSAFTYLYSPSHPYMTTRKIKALTRQILLIYED